MKSKNKADPKQKRGGDKKPPNQSRPGNKPDDETKIETFTREWSTELAMQDSDDKYRLLFETMELGVVYQDAKGKIISANPAAERILGLSLDQMLGRVSLDPRWKAIHEDGSEFPGETHPSMVALKTGSPVKNIILGVFHPVEEATHWININAIPLYKPGEPIPYQVYTTFEDITKRKEAEEAKKANEDRLNLFFDATHELISLRDENAITLWANLAWQKIFGDISDTRTEPFSILHPDDYDTVKKAWKAMVSGEGDINNLEYRFKLPGGEYGTFESTTYPVLMDGERRFYIVSHDITERKQLEQALRESETCLRTAVLSSEIIFAQTDLDLRYTWIFNPHPDFNPNELIGKRDDELDTNGGSRQLIKLKQQVIDTEKCLQKDITFELLEGAITYTITADPLYDSNDQVVGVITCGVNITKHLQSEEALLNSEIRYRELFNNISSGVAIYSTRDNGNDFVFQDFNKAGEKMDGHLKEDLIGKSILEARPTIKEFGLFDVLKRVWKTGVPEYFPESHYKDNNITGWYENYVYKLSTGEIVAVFDNVTGRKQGEEELQKSEAKFRNYIETSQDLIWECDGEGKFMYLNPAWEETTGYKLDEMLGKPFTDFTIPEEVEENSAEFARHLEGGSALDYPTTYISKNGSKIALNFNAVPLLDSKKNIIGTQGSAHDITQRKLAEQKVSYQANLLQNVPDAIIATDMDFLITSWNKAAELIYGWKEDEVLGKNIDDVCKTVFFGESQEESQNQLLLNGYWQGEIFQRNKANVKIRVLAAVSMIKNIGGKIIGGVAVNRNISKQKQVESDFENMFNLSQDLLAICSTDGDFLKVNPSWERVLGYSQKELFKLGWNGLVHPDDVEQTNKIVEEQLEGGPVVNFVNRYKCKDGSYKTLEWQATYAVEGIVHATARDVTEKNLAGDVRKKHAIRLKILSEINLAILEAESSEDIAKKVLALVPSILPSDLASITLFDPITDEIIIIGATPPGKREEKAPTRFSRQASDIYKTLKRGKIHIISDLDEKKKLSPVERLLQMNGIRSVMNVPLMVQDQLIGSLNLSAKGPGGFSEEYLETALEIAKPIANALQNALLFEQVERGRIRLKALSRQLIEIQEKERRTIALDLHDQIGQSLTAIKINLQTSQLLKDPDSIKQNVLQGMEIIDDAIDQVRTLSVSLRPSMLEDLGLMSAIMWMIDQIQDQSDIEIIIEANLDQGRLAPLMEITCYRIIQEALTNTIRHSDASQANIQLIIDDQELHLKIQDNGTGFNVESAKASALQGESLGLLSMEERAELIGGRFEISSEKGSGTNVSVIFLIDLSSPIKHQKIKRGKA